MSVKFEGRDTITVRMRGHGFWIPEPSTKSGRRIEPGDQLGTIEYKSGSQLKIYLPSDSTVGKISWVRNRSTISGYWVKSNDVLVIINL